MLTKIEREPASYDAGIKYFVIKYGDLADELQEGFGSMQSIFMDYWQEFRDYRKEFKDFRQEFRDFRKEFNDYRQEFRDYRKEFKDFRRDVKIEFKRLRRDIRALLNERLRKIEEDIAIIKAKLGLKENY